MKSGIQFFVKLLVALNSMSKLVEVTPKGYISW